MTVKTIYRKGVYVNYKNMNNEIIAPDYSHKKCRTNAVAFGIELRALF